MANSVISLIVAGLEGMTTVRFQNISMHRELIPLNSGMMGAFSIVQNEWKLTSSVDRDGRRLGMLRFPLQPQPMMLRCLSRNGTSIG